MKKRTFLAAVLLLSLFLLAACQPQTPEATPAPAVPTADPTGALARADDDTVEPPASATPSGAQATATPPPSATTRATATDESPSQQTVIVTTSEAVLVSPPMSEITPEAPATQPPATPIPPMAGGLSPTRLKYVLLETYPNMFYCDPDYYPVSYADEQGRAVERFPGLQANPEEFKAILDHLGMSGQTSFTGEEKLTIYREHKRLAAVILEPSGPIYRYELTTEERPGSGFIMRGRIDLAGLVMEMERLATIPGCPICLAGGTLIDTPAGAMPVEQLRVGDQIWTVDESGARVAAPVVQNGRTFVPASHQMVHVVLADGRELWVSPGHPTADGRRMSDLQAGEVLDGARIDFLEWIAYDQPATYDILPAGDTGTYWANGILLGSTLFGD